MRRISDNEFSHASISQGIGNHHTFTIRLPLENMKSTLSENSKWIGKTVVIGIDQVEEKKLDQAPLKESFRGIITSLAFSRQNGAAELMIQGYSPTVITDDGPNTRSFTDKGIQEIVNEVLQPYKFHASPKIEPKAYKDSLLYTVQYKESNFSFLTRLANQFGEWFYYDGLDLHFGKPAGEDTIELDFGTHGLSHFNLSVRAVPSSQELRGYDYTTNKFFSQDAPGIAKTSELGKQVKQISTKDLFTQKPSITQTQALDEKELGNFSKRREQIAVDEMVVLHGASRNSSIRLGAKIKVKDIDAGEDYGTFTLTSITHEIAQGGDYMNFFEAIPEEVETAPLTSMPEPPFCESQLAKVTNVNDNDKLGRVKVKFFWQEGSQEESPWIRVASPYTGKDKGFYMIPEVGDQVLVAFENNHPDKPYVLTGMYNNEATPEWFDAKNKFKGFKSKGGNKWKFDDNNKQIQLHAPNSILQSAGKTIAVRSGKKDEDSSIVLKEGKSIEIASDGSQESVINIDAGDGTINIYASKINFFAKEVIEMNSNQEIKQEAKQKVEIKGMEIQVEGSGKVATKGAQVDINGSAMVDVKGGLIKLN